MVTLNEKIVKSAEIKDKIYYIWDNKIIGFGLKVIPNGKKKYVFHYLTYYGGRNAKQRWFLFASPRPKWVESSSFQSISFKTKKAPKGAFLF